MNKKEFEALCYDQFILALDGIQENAPEDYATIGRDEFAAVAYRVFSQGVFMGYNIGTKKVAAALEEAGVAKTHFIDSPVQ
jgi:hypothetical protein